MSSAKYYTQKIDIAAAKAKRLAGEDQYIYRLPFTFPQALCAVARYILFCTMHSGKFYSMCDTQKLSHISLLMQKWAQTMKQGKK